MSKKTPGWIVRRAIKRSVRNCGEKRVFKTVDEAAEFVKPHHGNQLVYPCRVCGHYHITTNRQDG